MNYQNLITPKNRFGYTQCLQCKKPGMVLDFAVQKIFCPLCNFKQDMHNTLVHQHFIDPKSNLPI